MLCLLLLLLLVANRQHVRLRGRERGASSDNTSPIGRRDAPAAQSPAQVRYALVLVVGMVVARAVLWVMPRCGPSAWAARRGASSNADGAGREGGVVDNPSVHRLCAQVSVLSVLPLNELAAEPPRDHRVLVGVVHEPVWRVNCSAGG